MFSRKTPQTVLVIVNYIFNSCLSQLHKEVQNLLPLSLTTITHTGVLAQILATFEHCTIGVKIINQKTYRY